MRKNSNYKPWLDPLESMSVFQYPMEFEDSTNPTLDPTEALDEEDDDADELIQSNISREFVQSQLDPFALKRSGKTDSRILKDWDLGDFIGIGLAAGCAILFIFILYNIEEWIE